MKRTIKKVYRRLFARRSCYKLNKLLLECGMHGLGILNFENDRISGEANFLRRTLRRYLPSDRKPVFVDVGANMGDYSADLLKWYPDSRVISIEPQANNYRYMQKHLQQAEMLNVALGAEVGSLTLYDRNDSEISCHASMYREVITDLHHVDVVEHQVDVTTLDQLLAERSIDRVDLLKIDTEGHEFEVLKGATEALAQQRIPLIHLEFNEMNVVSRVFFRDFRQLLAGYQFFRLLPNSMIEIPDRSIQSEWFAYQNIVCVHESLQAAKRTAA